MDAICEFIPEECRSQQLVVDVAAGTGLIGIEVYANYADCKLLYYVVIALRLSISLNFRKKKIYLFLFLEFDLIYQI